MTETIVFPDVAAAVIAYLREQLVSVWVGHIPPKDTATRTQWVTVTRSGGTVRDRVVDEAQITVDVWAQKTVDAADLAQLVRAHLHALRSQTTPGPVVFYSIQEFSGPAWLPDPVTDRPRFRQTIQIGARGAAT